MFQSDKMEDYQKIITFAKNKCPHSGFGNLYLARTIDRDGNVKSETYGMNEFTDYGFSQFFGGVNWPRNLYIGKSDDYNLSNRGTSIIHDQITPDSDRVSSRDTHVDYKYPMYYSSELGLVTCVCKFQHSVFDYTLTNVESDVNVTEYGIGSAIDKLWTHSWVYDIQGARTIVVKEPNVELVIDVYFCLTYPISVITNGYANNRFAVITTLENFIDNRMAFSNVGTFRRFNSVAERSKSNTISTTQNVQTNAINIDNFTIQDNIGAEHGYVDGFYTRADGSIIVDSQTLPASSPESFSYVIRNPIADCSSTSLSTLFGKIKTSAEDANRLSIPITQVDLNHVYLYDVTRKDYTNDLAFTNDPNKWYTETSLQPALHCHIYYTNIDDNIYELFVYQNLHPEDPIVEFTDTNVSTVYGTNTYWDRSDWEWISDYHNIPANSVQGKNLQTCRYYITSSNTYPLNPVRTSKPLTLHADPGEEKTYAYPSYESTAEEGYVNASNGTCENITNGYYVRNRYVFFPTLNARYAIGGNATSSSYWKNYQHLCYQNYVLTIYTNSNPSYIFISNLTNQNAPVSAQFTIVDASDNTKLSGGNANAIFATDTNQGVIVLQRTDGNECLCIDLKNSTGAAETAIAHKVYQSQLACGVYNTKTSTRQIAYVTTDATPILKVVDYDTDSVVDTFTLPGIPVLMWALNGYIWATNGASWCQVYQVGTSTTNATGVSCTNYPTTWTSRTNINQLRFTMVDDVILLYDYLKRNRASVYYTRIDDNGSDITSIHNLSDFGAIQDQTYWASWFQLKYIQNGKTLALLYDYTYIVSSSYNSIRGIIDFGQYLYPTSSDPIVNHYFENGSGYQQLGWCTYGENVIFNNQQIPIAYFMPMKLVGTTRTITAINTYKNISNKQWQIQYTNSPPANWPNGYPGYPPGTKN